MRSAHITDIWEKVYKRDYTNFFTQIDLMGLNGINSINMQKGLVAICGLNGAGKSTIISAIKDTIGLKLTNNDTSRIKGANIKAEILSGNDTVEFSNNSGDTLYDKKEEIEIKYIDSSNGIKIQESMIDQTNVEELLELYEEYKFTSSELDEISYLIGKSYSSCSAYEIDDLEGEEGTFPFFVVEDNGVKYDMRTMGNGELFILDMYWCIKRMRKDSILIIEEPETYISISSQLNFTAYIGEIISSKGISVIMTTHSPFILENIKNENIRIVSRINNEVSIVVPDTECTCEDALGIQTVYRGTIFVEDKVAHDLLKIILLDKMPWVLRKYSIDIVGGESEITKRLEFPKSKSIHYKFIGIYDGDVRESILKNESKLQWDFDFLPGETSVEEIIYNYVKSNLDKFCEIVHKDKSKVVLYLSTIEGEDYHDWFIDLSRKIGVTPEKIIEVVYNEHLSESLNIADFINSIQKKIN